MSTTLAATVSGFDAILARLRANLAADEPGGCAALVVAGGVVRQEHWGMAHLEWRQAIATDTRFYLASEAKPWTAALTLGSVAAGKIGLTDDVRERLPALAGYEQPIRLGHLLRHTSGIDDYLLLWRAQLGRHAHDTVTQAQALELIRRAEDVRFVPGSRFEYSNSNYVLLAELLQQLEALSLADLAQQRCFAPWGLEDIGFEDQPERVLPRRARSYRRAGLHLERGWHDLPVALASWGDGGLWSSLSDLVRVECLWQRDERGAARRFLLDACLQDDTRFAPPASPYRFGLEVAPCAGRQIVFHGGGLAGFSSLVLRCPAERVSLVLLSNREDVDVSGPAGAWAQALWAG